MNKKIIISRSMSIGNVSAENDDDFLFNCYVDHPIRINLKDTKSSKSFILGSTGSGKTALIKKISNECDNYSIIELSDLSMSYISNSNVIRFIKDMNVSLDYFFQALWRHIIIIEYIRTTFDITSSEKSQKFFDRIREVFGRNEARKKAIDYLERWSDKFWVSFDENIREIEQNLEKEVSVSIGFDVQKYKSDAGYTRKLGELKRAQYQSRLKEIVSANLLSELSRIQDTLFEYSKRNQQRSVHIFIDGLDENWVDKDIKYKLIKALIESVKSLRKINNLKVISAIRVDVLERVVQETRHDGFQSEKYADYFAELKWTSSDIKQILSKRINYLYHSQYDSDNVFLEDILPEKISKKNNSDFICERTLLRPRDGIAFLNKILSESQDKVPISPQVIVKAERNYSEERKRALIEEWYPVYPALDVYLSVIGKRRSSFRASDLMKSNIVDTIAIGILNTDGYEEDSVCKKIIHLYEKSGSVSCDQAYQDIIIEILRSLHLTGAIGLNTSPNEPLHWFYKEGRQISSSNISSESKVSIHPMLYSALGVNDFQVDRNVAST